VLEEVCKLFLKGESTYFHRSRYVQLEFCANYAAATKQFDGLDASQP
jgi:hypothetical protein